MFLVNYMLEGDMREYIMHKVKAPLMKALIKFAQRYPEPTRDNIIHPNTLKLLDIQDKFFKYENNLGRNGLFRALFRIFIDEYEHDPYYHYRFDWFLEEIVNCGWKPRPIGYPSSCWNESDDKASYGGGYLVKFGVSK
ncbi:hypothetical protein LCGC14_0405880 [marine sediment metagenome]|uniref:Uncharacterized protein n=1 Tax=marine sediment metagenome TaxID=412755 RepID=A0A0F9T0W5_9ZZZZ